MYTEISHFLLLHTIFIANLQFFCLVTASDIWRIQLRKKYFNFEKNGFASKPIHLKRGYFTIIKQQFNCKSFVESSWFGESYSLYGNFKKNRDPLISFAPIFFFILTSCFFGTIGNYVCSDFSIYNILTNSTSDVPLLYKVSATWSNHEGSLLLWCWLLSLNTFLLCISFGTSKFVRFSSSLGRLGTFLRKKRFEKINTLRAFLRSEANWMQMHKIESKKKKSSFNNQEFIEKNWILFFRFIHLFRFFPNPAPNFSLTTKTSFTASFILLFFTTFCIATSNPFLRTTIPCINSLAELNPILQDPVLAIHPPCIYAGYVASAIAFSICMSYIHKN